MIKCLEKSVNGEFSILSSQNFALYGRYPYLRIYLECECLYIDMFIVIIKTTVTSITTITDTTIPAIAPANKASPDEMPVVTVYK